ncbi:MAG: transcriptional regulator [Betaproteobacteria bacterium HGW-Betaproteobacteria-15]|nr:MAG: transcriptional regulator [Betaproteobacteria bacterium HGW-Betaproteobacteria-15]
MNTVRPIRTEQQRLSAVARLEALYNLDPVPGTPESDELELLEMVMEKYDQENQQDWPCSAIDALRFHMDQKGLNKKDLEPFIGSSSRVSEILSGKRSLTLTMIRNLHAGLRIPATSLIAEDSPISGEQLSPFDHDKYPLAEMAERQIFGNVPLRAAELKARASELVEGFLRSVQHSHRPQAYLRAPLHQSGNRTIDEPSLLIWSVCVVQKARTVNLRGKYVPGVITPDWLRELAKLSAFDTGPKLAQEHLSRHGICLVTEKHFAKTYLDGAAMLDGDLPVVGLTLRHNRVDNFWFALFHELVHVGFHLKPECPFIADNLEDKGRRNQDFEEEADRITEEALIPAAMWSSSKVRTTHSLEDAIELAEAAGVHPAIVAGRVRYKTGNWRLLSGVIKSAGTVERHFEDQL